MQIKELLTKTYKSTSLTPEEVDLLLAHALHKSKEYLYKNSHKELRRSSAQAFRKVLRLAHNGWPMAYLLGYREFFGRKFRVNKHTLIPRPDSEIIIETALKFLHRIKKSEANIVDIGTGSGCLIISLAAENKQSANYFATDLSSPALAVARTNSRKILRNKKIKFVRTNLLDKLPEKFDLIIANLPYLVEDQLTEPSISHEPRTALYGGKDGLDFYKNLLTQLPNHLAKDYLVLLEIDPSQSKKLSELIKKTLPESKVSIIKDKSGLERVVEIS